MKNGINRRTIFASELSWNRVCVAVVRYSLYDANFRQRLDYVSFGSVSGTYIHIYIYACAGTEERKTRSWPLRAVRLLNSTPGVSRLLTRAFPPPPATRWRQASPPFDPAPPPRPSTTRKRDPHPGIVVGRSRGSDPSTSSIDGNLTADRKARLPLRSSAKIAMKASRHLESFSSLLIPLVWPFFLFFSSRYRENEKQKNKHGCWDIIFFACGSVKFFRRNIFKVLIIRFDKSSQRD